jgi:hypothetical protein
MARSSEMIPHPLKYAAMPLEARKKLLPERNVCSLYPAKEHCDYFWTGDGFQRVDEMGDPYGSYAHIQPRPDAHTALREAYRIFPRQWQSRAR